MVQVVLAACPGCRQVLRIPLEWVDQPMKCKHCGLVFRAQAKAAPAVPPAPAPRPAQPAAPPARGLARPPSPARNVPTAIPVAAPARAAPAGAPSFSAFDFEAPSGPGRRRRRRSGGGWWKGAVAAVCTLGIASGVAAVAWPYLTGMTQGLPPVAVVDKGGPGGPAVPVARPPAGTAPATPPRRPADTGRHRDEAPPRGSTEPARPRPLDTAPHKPPAPPVKPQPPAPPPVKPPAESPQAPGKFPRRALIVSVSNYLYFNPVNYGSLSQNQADVHSLVNQLNKGLDIPLDQVVELSDATPDPAGKRGRGARAGAVAPLKPVIEQTVTDFLQASRPQDRLVVFFLGHAVDLDGEVYLVPIDGERDRKASLLPLKWLYDKLAACTARQKILIVDVCRFDPSRGFERPGSGSPDGKVEGAMTEKIDEALKNPPAGVQVWSACVAGQHSLEYDNNGAFVDALWHLAGRGIDGVIQRRDGPIPIERLVEPVNKYLAARLGPYGKTQTTRLVGKEPETGAAYDPAEPLPPKVVPKLPAALADAYPVDELRKLLEQVELPPIKIAQDEVPLRAEALPPFPAKVMAAYKDEGAETDLRKAIKAAVTALGKTRDKRLRDEWPVPADENAQKLQITDYQRRELAGVQRELDEALGDLKKAGTPEKRAAEPRRWQAHYDFVLARLEEELAYLNEYQGLLGQMKKELPPIDRKVQNGWRVASQASLSDSAAKKLATDAKKLLDKIVKEYPNTPWEVLARRDRLTALGMEWQATRLGQ
jgi:hypothetical protein